MANGIFFEFDASHYAVVVLSVLGATVVLPIAWTPLLKLCWRGPKLSSQAETRSVQQRLCNNYIQLWDFGTASSDHDLKRS